jgi:NAD(P)H-quinone oxidoreductase subunit 5
MIQSIHQYACFIPILPSLTAAILGFGLLGARRTLNSQRWPVAFVSIFTLMITMFLSIAILYEQVNNHSAHSQVWSWIEVNGWSLQVGYLVDPLSAIMLVVVTSVAVTVMIYTHGYMQHDQGYVRFFMYLTLFTASMLGLVLSPNLVQVYIFWELVGMCSYLLVGFWFTRPSAAYACQKAFVTNRVGDLGLLLGILGLYWLTGSLDFNTIASRIHEQLNTNTVPELWVTLCCICLFLGPIAKSAQFPLHVWLPDAMEGPTPISALIHAATMVAAGVFLVSFITTFPRSSICDGLYCIYWSNYSFLRSYNGSCTKRLKERLSIFYYVSIRVYDFSPRRRGLSSWFISFNHSCLLKSFTLFGFWFSYSWY